MTRRLTAVCLAAFVALGGLIVRHSVAIPATRWMNIYDPSDFPSFSSLLAFLRDLRVPIPPVIASAEVISFQLLGSPDLVTVAAYRLAMVLSFATAIYLAATTRLRLAVSFVASLVFLWGTVQVHPFNPQVYDVLFPLFVLFWIAGLGWAANRPEDRFASVLCVLLSGFFLSMAELTRPFFVLILPFALVGSLAYLGLRRRLRLAAFLLPVLLLSGGWHMHQVLAHGQILWSNHGGFNLAHAWPQAGIRPDLLRPEAENAPISPGRWENINTDAHSDNSDRLTAAVIRFIAVNPLRSLEHALVRMSVYLVGPVPSASPTTPPTAAAAMLVYRLAMIGAILYVLVETAAAGAALVWAGTASVRWLVSPGGLLAFVVAASLVLQALGSAVEEARMVLSLLPLMAALPSYGAARFLAHRPEQAARVAWTLVAAGLVVLAVSLAWDPLRGLAWTLSDRQVAAALLAGGLVAMGFFIRRTSRSV